MFNNYSYSNEDSGDLNMKYVPFDMTKKNVVKTNIITNDIKKVPSIDLNFLNSDNDAEILKKNKKEIIFNKILEKCHNKIIETKKTSCVKFCNFSPPFFIFGESVYDYDELIEFLINNLTNNGIYVMRENYGDILIKWDIESLNKQKTLNINKSKKAVDNICYYDSKNKEKKIDDNIDSKKLNDKIKTNEKIINDNNTEFNKKSDTNTNTLTKIDIKNNELGKSTKTTNIKKQKPVSKKSLSSDLTNLLCIKDDLLPINI